jgi:hypothetical protein
VASKCLEEVKLARRTFARGKYFGHKIHEASDVLGNAVDKVPVKATFLSFPIFALLESDDVNQLPLSDTHSVSNSHGRSLLSLLRHLLCVRNHHKGRHFSHCSSRAERVSSKHPVRSLSQYSNILAADHSRDHQQVIARTQDGEDGTKPFIHVPEIWALTINMCITRKRSLAPNNGQTD